MASRQSSLVFVLAACDKRIAALEADVRSEKERNEMLQSKVKIQQLEIDELTLELERNRKRIEADMASEVARAVLAQTSIKKILGTD